MSDSPQRSSRISIAEYNTEQPTSFRARAEHAIPVVRTQSPAWEKKSEQMDVRETSAGYVPAFSFKHGSPAVNCTREKRASHRKLANLEKFLGSVKKSAMMEQYDGLPFHSLSTSKRYRGFIKGSESKRDESITFFESEFEVVERIGFGNFAEVFKVRWRRDNRIYALKRSIARFGSCFDNEQPHEEQLRWMDEAFYHTSVSGHPNIVECVQSWEEAGYFHIQMEYMPERLDTFALKNYPIPENILWNCFTDLLMALDHVHKKGYCHFDLKPENIFLDEFKVTKLGDFSLISDPEADHNEAGDARYLPLEAMESKTLGFAVDIFSLGITMLELCTDIQLTGHGAEWRALREGPLPVEFEDRIPVAMRQMLRQMMSLDPRLRPSAASLLRLHPLSVHVIRRKSFQLALPLLRLQHAAADFIWSGISCGTLWIKAFLPTGQQLPDRPETPPPNIDFAEHALRHHFSASVQKPKTRTQTSAPAFDGFSTRPECDSIGTAAPQTTGEPDSPEILQRSFLEVIEGECESDTSDLLEGDSLFEDGESPEMPEDAPDSDELNHVQMLVFSDDESEGEESK
ncbi:putative Membrane-associated tyrosine- and threonine-specific cdc2-inhibitory kinase wee-1.3 [Hypsibius exemplaris]|uniref:non-specific serine/threonine protein kinase n=1 Tax=Hypsibius exemplaris TaxID=2072580 RepID=A0A1W0WB18_HYPEX|nr:putative Membrane-associated tyrosine- and threonine-specific cdc2-inhibitory kinase wee-1.3 [Hypsibius exemplaris]